MFYELSAKLTISLFYSFCMLLWLFVIFWTFDFWIKWHNLRNFTEITALLILLVMQRKEVKNLLSLLFNLALYKSKRKSNSVKPWSYSFWIILSKISIEISLLIFTGNIGNHNCQMLFVTRTNVFIKGWRTYAGYSFL